MLAYSILKENGTPAIWLHKVFRVHNYSIGLLWSDRSVCTHFPSSDIRSTILMWSVLWIVKKEQRTDRIPPLHFCRQYLTDRFLVRTITHTHSLLPKSIQKIEALWRFTPSKLPLLCKRFKLISKFEKFRPELPTYHVSHLSKNPFSQIDRFNYLFSPNCLHATHTTEILG